MQEHSHARSHATLGLGVGGLGPSGLTGGRGQGGSSCGMCDPPGLLQSRSLGVMNREWLSHVTCHMSLSACLSACCLLMMMLLLLLACCCCCCLLLLLLY